MPVGGTAEIIHKFRQVFRHYDEDKDNLLTVPDLLSLMTAATSTPPTPDEVTSWATQHGRARAVHGRDALTVNFEEFLALATSQLDAHLAVEPAPHDVFAVFDKDGTGMVDRRELMAVFADLGVSVTEDEVTAMIEEAVGDLGDVEEIGYSEFLRMYEKVRPAASTRSARENDRGDGANLDG